MHLVVGDKTEAPKSKPIPPRMWGARCPQWGPARFPRGVEDLHRCYEEVPEAAFDQLVTSAQFYYGSGGQPKMTDGTTWRKAYYFLFEDGTEAALFVPEKPCAHSIMLFARGVAPTVDVDSTLERLVASLNDRFGGL